VNLGGHARAEAEGHDLVGPHLREAHLDAPAVVRDLALVGVGGVGERALREAQRARDVFETGGQIVRGEDVAGVDGAAVAEGDGVVERLAGRGGGARLAVDARGRRPS
jgi:hypothetical protein